MGKSKSAKQQVTDYRLSVHFGVSLGPVDYFRAIRVNEKDIWRGQAGMAGYQAFPINNPNLFGGPKKEGGVEGTLHLLPGRADQVFPNALAQRQGRTSETSVAYRGVASFFLTGKTRGQGFMWSTNSPIVATQVEAEVTRMPKGLDAALVTIPNPRHPTRPDANAAHIIYEAATDPVDGIMLPEDMDYASFNAAAQTLFNEKMGLTLIWTDQMKCEDFINEVQGHINSVTYLDPVTGKFTIKLIRDDYDPEDLFEINEDNATLVSFQRRFLGETVNEITVTYTDPETEEDATLTVHDLASAQTQGRVADTRNYYGFRHPEIAETAAWRELRAANAPLALVEVRINREGWSLRPGQPVRVYFPHEDPDQHIDIIARTDEIDYGEPGAEEIPLSLTEDVFSLTRPPNSRSIETEWVDESEPPSPMMAQQVFTLPTYMVLSSSYQDSTTDLQYPEVLAGVLGHHTSPDALSFELADAEVQPTGELEVTPAGTKTLTERGTLLQSIPPEATSDVLMSTLPLGRGPRIGGFVLLGAVETTQEIALISGFDGISWTLERGVLDTVPRSWPSGTPVWYLNPNTRFVDDRTVRSAGEEVTYRLLTRTSRGQLDVLEAPPVTGTLTDRPHLPLRPANVAINGVPILGTVNVAGVDDIAITWATRNRLLEDGQVVRWDAAPVAPEYKQRTIVLVTDEAGNEIRRYKHLWTENGFSMPKAWFARWSAVKVYVFAERDGLTSLQVLGYTVTGLANDQNAPEPPAAPDEGVPPSPVLAPAVGVFTAQGGLMDGADGGAKIPVIVITGRREDPRYLALVVRYAKSGVEPPDWQYHPAATLDERELVLPIPVSSNTTYRPEIAYVADGVVGAFRALPEVTSGTLVADNVTNVGDRPAATITYTIDQILVRQDQIDLDVDAVQAQAQAAYAAREAAEIAASTASTAASNSAAAQGLAEQAFAAAAAARDAAIGARDGAITARDETVTQVGLAESYVSAAASHAATATAQADLSGERADAAQADRVLAETARGQAQAHAQSAASSASDASGYVSQASSSATVAAGARDDALTALSGAEGARDAALGHANAASSQASVATAQADLAGQRASAAESERVLAETARGQAQTAATNAASSESNASGYASQAASSAVVSAGARDAARRTATLASSRIDVQSVGVKGFTDAGNFGPDAPDTTRPTVTDYGVHAGKLTVELYKTYISTKWVGTPQAGRTIRLYVRFRTGGNAGGGLRPYIAFLDAAYAYQNETPLATQYDYNWNYSTYTWEWTFTPEQANHPFYCWLLEHIHPGGPDTDILIWQVWWEDVTSEKQAAASASASASSASLASASETAAGQHASAAQSDRILAETARGQAQTAAVNAASASSDASGYASQASSSASVSAGARDASISAAAENFPADFSQGVRFFTPSLTDGGAPIGGGAWAEWTTGADAGGPFLRMLGNNGGYYHVRPLAVRAATPGRRYRGTFVARNSGGNPDVTIGAAFYGLDATRTELLYGGFGTEMQGPEGAPGYNPSLGGSYYKLVKDIVISSNPACPYVIFAPYAFRTGGAPLGPVDVLLCGFEDVTESVSAATSAAASAASASAASASESAAGQYASSASTEANNASTYAGDASAYRDQAASSASAAGQYASAAQSSAVLSANVSVDSLAPNARFVDYPGIGVPARWQLSELGSTSTYRVAGDGMQPWAMRVDCALATDTAAVLSEVSLPSGEGWYVADADVTLLSGSLYGAGMTVRGNSGNTGEYVHEQHLWFALDADATGSVPAAGVVGRRYRFTKLLRLNGPSMGNTRLYAFTNGINSYSGAGGSAAKQLIWHKASYRRATQSEIELGVARSDSPTLSARLAAIESVAASATSAVATRTSTLEARVTHGANMLTNPTGNLGFSGWSQNLYTVAVDSIWGPWFRRLFTNDGGAYGYMRSDAIPAGSGQTYVLSGRAYLTGLVSGFCQLAVYSYTDDAGTQGEVLVNHHYWTDGASHAWNTPLPPLVLNTPANSRSLRVWSQSQPSGNGSYSDFGFWQLKLEYGSTPTIYTDDASTRAVASRVTVTEGAIATLNGRNLAYLQQEVNTGPGASAFVALRAETSPGVVTSSVALGAHSISLYNQVGQNWRLALRIENGNAIFSGGLQAGTYIRLGSGAGWPVALASRDFSVGDGDLLEWGTTFDGLPNWIAKMNNLDALATGEVYDVRLTNVTTTGATAYCKIITVAQPSNYSVAMTTPGGSGPTYRAEVTSAGRGESSNGYYDITFSTHFNSSFYHSGPSQEMPVMEGYEDSGTIQMDVYALKSGVWTFIKSELFFHNVIFNGGYVYQGWNAYNGSSYSATRSINMGSGVQAIGVSFGGRDGGSGPYASGSGSATNSAWQAAGTPSGTRSATPNGRKTNFTVTPA